MSYTAGNFDSPHVYLQWGGKLPGNESWSCGIRMRRKSGTAVPADATALLFGTSAALAAFHTSGVTNIGTGAKLSFVKCNTIAVTGLYADSAGHNEATYADLPGGGTSAQVFPNQIALAVSLTTGYTRGPAHKGRFYLPLFNATLDSGGRIPADQAISVSGSVDTLLSALNAVDANFEAAVFSRKSGAAGNRKITGNLIGRVLDTQRRRRRNLVEDYQ